MQKYNVQVYDNRTEWRQNGVLHRDDGPAIEWNNGDKCWYQNGKLHRTDGPAEEWATGSKAWYQNGKLHRIDGPAIDNANGYRRWYIIDNKLTNDEIELLQQNPNNVAFLLLKYS